MKAYEELSVLEQGDDGAIVSIYGQKAPFVLLGAGYLGHLAGVLESAQTNLTKLSPTRDVAALALLCREISNLLKSYDNTCCKYTGDLAAPKTIAEIEHGLEELRKELERM